jgi:hypothetical protein
MREVASNRWNTTTIEDQTMKLFVILTTSAMLTAAMGAEPSTTTGSGSSPMKTISEKALAVQKEALAIEGILKMKSPDLAMVAERAGTLDKHVAEMQAAMSSVEAVGEAAKMKASVDVLKVLTENKAKQLAEADDKDRGRFRATAKNIAMRAEQIRKTSQKIGG